MRHKLLALLIHDLPKAQLERTEPSHLFHEDQGRMSGMTCMDDLRIKDMIAVSKDKADEL